MSESIFNFVFKWRGLLMAAVALVVLAVAKPTLDSCCKGLFMSVLGELLRSWALGWTGEHTRSQKTEAPYLVVSGPYRYVRNPLYLGNIIIGCGVLTAACGALSFSGKLLLWFGGLGATYFVYTCCIKSEEAFLAERFGQSFLDYCANTPPFWPSYTHLRDCLSKPVETCQTSPTQTFDKQSLKFEASTWMWLFLVWSYLFIRAGLHL
jgi:protein-S-isoprenylcysteine O-methyltransferase Ste14